MWSTTLLTLTALCGSVYGYPGRLTARDSAPTARVIVPPPKPTDTGIKQIPDDAHPFQAPGPNDLRGPCPGLNTLANHGYLPRNGVASFEQIIQATGEGFNMEYDLASALAAFGILARGNAEVNLLSIGLPTPLVPPLPGNIDGPQALGIATHGRFEGDVSMTRADAAIGDNRNFNQGLFNELLQVVSIFGGNDPVTGPKSIVNNLVMSEFKAKRFIEDQLKNHVLQYHIGRFLLSYGEASFTLNFFANGTEGTLSVPVMTSFFKDQMFPTNNWHRRGTPGGLELIGTVATEIVLGAPVLPGANVLGLYIPDIELVNPICGLYNNLASDNLPAVLLNTTGILKQNVDTLLNAIFNLFAPSGCPKVLPKGPAGV